MKVYEVQERDYWEVKIKEWDLERVSAHGTHVLSDGDTPKMVSEKEYRSRFYSDKNNAENHRRKTIRLKLEALMYEIADSLQCFDDEDKEAVSDLLDQFEDIVDRY